MSRSPRHRRRELLDDPCARRAPRLDLGARIDVLRIGAANDGFVYVVSATPARVFRFRPDPSRVFDARGGKADPYIDLAALTGNPKMKSENLLVDGQSRVYVTSGDAYDFQHGAGGVVWRVSSASN